MTNNEIATLVAKLNNQFSKVTTVTFKESADIDTYDIDIVATKCRFEASQCTRAQYDYIESMKNVYRSSNGRVRNASKACASAIITVAKENPCCIFRVV